MVIPGTNISWLISVCNILLLVCQNENSVESAEFEHRTYVYKQFLWSNGPTQWEME